MSAYLLGTYPVGSDDWKAARAKGLGGSEIAAVLGLSKWDSRYSLWLAKAGVVSGEKELTPPMIVGNYVESALQSWWQDQHPEVWLNCNPGTYAARDRPWQVASPDGFVATNPLSLLECKFAVYDYEWGDEGTDEIPPYYLAQCRWYLDVFDLDVCHLAVLFGGSGRFAEYVVRQDPTDVELMREAAVVFLASVEAGVRPDIDEHSATYEAIRKEHDGIDRDAVVALDPAEHYEYVSSKEALEAAEIRHRLKKSVILNALGDARIGTVYDEPVLRRQPGQRGSIALHTIKPPKEAA